MHYFKIIGVIFVLLGIDLYTKYLFFDLGLLPNRFEATLNTGISFSIPVNQLAVEIVTIVFIISI